MDDALQTVPGGNNDNKQQDLRNEENIFEFEEQSWKTDFVISVEGTRLHVARNILCLASPVFDRMLQSEFKESESGVYEMPTHKLEDVKLFLKCIYPNMLKPISCEIAKKILPLIEEYQVLQLKAACEKAIIESVSDDISTDLLYQTLREACLYNLTDAREKCVHLASRKTYEEIDLACRQYSLPREIMNEILRCKVVDMEKLNKELKCTNSKHIKRISNLEEHETVIKSDLRALYEYMAKDLQEVEDLRLDTDLKWKAAEILLKLDPSNDGRSTREVVVWDKKLLITANCNSTKVYGYPPKYVAVEIERRQPMVTNIEARFILIHGKSKSENMFCKISGQFPATKNTLTKYIRETSYLTDKKNGYVKDKYLWLVVQIFMSEPTST